MSAIKPVIREVKDAVLKGMAHGKEKLHQFADNLGDQFDTVVREIRDKDKYDDVTTTRGRNRKTTTYDPSTGRPVSEQGTILDDFGGTTRGDNATEIGRLGNPGDHGGHLGAHRFFGDTPDQGIVPQAANLNLGAWKKMENEWAAQVNDGFQVDYTIAVNPPGAVRPDSFQVTYTVSDPSTGEIIETRSPSFQNVAGQTFHR